MKSQSTRLILSFILTLSLSNILTACQNPSDKSSSAPANPAPPTNNGPGGGTDGSGGDTLTSSSEQVTQALTNNNTKIRDALRNMDGLLQSQNSVLDQQYGKGSSSLLKKFFSPENQLQNIRQAFETGKISFQSQVKDCQSDTGHHDGSAKGDLSSGQICISIERLQKISPTALGTEILLLSFHEMSHLAGFSEDQAQQLQRLLGLYPEIYGERILVPDVKNMEVSGDDLIGFSLLSLDRNTCKISLTAMTTFFDWGWGLGFQNYTVSCTATYKVMTKNHGDIVFNVNGWSFEEVGLLDLCQKYKSEFCLKKFASREEDAQARRDQVIRGELNYSDQIRIQNEINSQYQISDKGILRLQEEMNKGLYKILMAVKASDVPECSGPRTLIFSNTIKMRDPRNHRGYFEPPGSGPQPWNEEEMGFKIISSCNANLPINISMPRPTSQPR